LVSKGFKATEWAQIVSDIVGGKNGGNDLSAQGAGTLTSSVNEAVLLAKEFASKMVL
jgi:alanyl-tRNA synthetase